ncbi:hypothetical protein D770_00125 [Flammeovirgaceae bacterium 311]|nr:hypothetical protein D770_00125 [Flammeovirgaceae bacterium 311]
MQDSEYFPSGVLMVSKLLIPALISSKDFNYCKCPGISATQKKPARKADFSVEYYMFRYSVLKRTMKP